MGSAILVDPAMRNAQARGAEIFFLIFKSNRASLTLLNTVKPENIFTIDSSSLSGLIKDTLRFLVLARYHRIDTVIDLELFSRFTALLTGLCGARKRVGYHIFHGEGLWRGFDGKVVDGAVNGAGYLVSGVSIVLRLLQNGSVKTYAASMFVGAVAVLAYYMWR